MTETYWNIGKYIVEVEQDGKATAIYDSKLLTNLSHELTLRMGKGYSRPNLNNMKKFYLRYPNCQTVSDSLSWSHICEWITIDDDLERQFYENECIKAKWDVSTLRRERGELLVEYATYGMDNNLFVSKYELYLPNRDDLRRLLIESSKRMSSKARQHYIPFFLYHRHWHGRSFALAGIFRKVVSATSAIRTSQCYSC